MTGLRRNVPSYEAYSPNGLLRERSTYKDGEWHGLSESYDENGQLESEGTYNMGEDRGEWIEDGETVTYDPCPPGLENGN